LFIRFSSNLQGSPLFDLLSRDSKEIMKDKGLSIFRFQNDYDENLSFIARQMSRKNFLEYTFVSKNSVTMVVPKKGDAPIPIFSMEDLQPLYDGNLNDFTKKENKIQLLSD
jgi:hypothetical protein